MSGGAIAGIIAGTMVEVVHVEQWPDGDVLVTLSTSPRSWAVMRAGPEADEVAQHAPRPWRLAIRMPRPEQLLFEKPEPPS